jgi:hypothetical protein
VKTVKYQEYNNLIAVGVALVAVVLVLVWATMAASSNGGPTSTQPTGPAHMYLTIQINPVTGWPQYSPANFTVPAGEVVFTIVDYDSPMNWTSCTCNVNGTVGGTETVNGTSYSVVSNANVAHTFDIPSLHLNVMSPGMSTVTFAVDLTQAGTYTWMCVTPCGINGYTGGAMSTPGYMSGTMTVV